MKKVPILFSLIFLINSLLSANSTITGKLIIDSTWHKTIYLSLISDFNNLNSISNQMIIESSEIDSTGGFYYKTGYLPSDYLLYRLHLSKKGDPPASLIIGGKDENHMLFIAKKNSTIIINNKASETLFGAIEISGSPQSHLITEVNKMLLYIDTTSFYNTPLKRELMENALNEKLRQFADTCSYPLVALYAIYKSDFESHSRSNPDFYVRFLKKWEKERSPYFNEFRKKITLKPERNYSFYYGIFGLILGASIMLLFRKVKNQEQSNPLHELTVQERNIFTLLQKGKSNKEISDELSISLSTVKSHVNNIFSKLNVKSRREILNL